MKKETTSFFNNKNIVGYKNLCFDPDYTIKPLKILLVEDHDIWASYVKLVLEKISREFLYARNGSEAIKICLNNPDIDFILMDRNMQIGRAHV